jgi:hypothetical protein
METKMGTFKKKKNHDEGMAIIDLRFDAADIDAVKRGDGRIVFSFSSDAERSDELCFDVERSTSDNVDALVIAAASFAWRISSVPDIEDGRRGPAVLAAAGGDLAPGRPSTEDVDDTRVWDTPVGDVEVESDARGRTGGGPIEPSIDRAGFTVVGVGTLVLDAVLGGVVAVALIRTLLPKAVTRAVIGGSSEVFPALGASLLASERREVGRDVFGGEKVLDSRRVWPILLGAGVVPTVPLTLIRRFICGGFPHSAQAKHDKEKSTNQLELLLLRIERDVESP